MTLGPALKKAINAVSCRATDAFFGWRHKRRWLDKQGLGGMHQSYFDEYQARLPVADTIAKLLETEAIGSPYVLEFGCSGGNNLKLLRERTSRPIRYCGLDIQEDAIAFARSAFPNDTFHVCSTEGLAALRPQLQHADIFLLSGVLYYLPQKEAQDVLNFAATIADHLVVCDILERFEQPQGRNDGLFLHPFREMCERAGFCVTDPPQLPQGEDRHGIFLAHAKPAERA